jgi:hypothetical protein
LPTSRVQVTSLLKTIGPPGSLGFLFAALVFCLLLAFIWPRRRRIAGVLLAGTLAGYLALSWPPLATILVDSLPAPPPTTIAQLPSPIEVLVLFDGDNRAGRVRLTEAVIKARSPGAVHAIGSGWILREMDDALRKRVAFDPAPVNTREQVNWLRQSVPAQLSGRTAVVVSRIQAPRVAGLLARSGADARLLASELDREPGRDGLRMVLPALSALAASRDALYEHAALLYYRWRGWL